ncbi:MAG: hypothetical protein ABWY16_20020 [Pedobacter sp.]|uniref:hypothetical protein n=1 Tax=Pedobacter sp. TaxID=1411316 RepID=UPI003394B24F
MNTKVLKVPLYLKFPQLLQGMNLKFDPKHLFVILWLIWIIFPVWFHSNDPTAGYVEQNTWLLIVLGLITFLLVVGLCWWLLRHFWTMAGLPEINKMINKFNYLTSWQQLSFFWASFALFLLAAIACIDAIC